MARRLDSEGWHGDSPPEAGLLESRRASPEAHGSESDSPACVGVLRERLGVAGPLHDSAFPGLSMASFTWAPSPRIGPLLRLIRPHRPQASQSIASKWKGWRAPNLSTAPDCGVPSSASHSCNIRFTSFRGRTVTGGKSLATLGGTVTWMKNAPPSKPPLVTCRFCSRSPGPHSRWNEG